jgi:hypothetical protein
VNALTKDFTDAVEKQFSALNAEVKRALDEAGVAKAIVTELEQKSARSTFGGESRPESWGEQSPTLTGSSLSLRTTRGPVASAWK